MRIYVLYHANCYDGFGAAFAAWLKLKDAATYIPVSYGNPPPRIEECDYLYLLDFSYSRPVLESLVGFGESKARRVIILDHHKTAWQDLAGLPDPDHLYETATGLFARFDMEESGATLAWRYFHGDDPPHMPALFAYLKDRDLWCFALPGSREVNAALRSYPFDFHVWEQFLADEALRRLQAEGRALLTHQEQMVALMCQQPMWVELGGHRVPCVNATVYFSEVGDYLCHQHQDAPFAAYYLDRADGKRQWGLRSRGEFDVSAIARQYGGGGHRNAAGFTTERPALL